MSIRWSLNKRNNQEIRKSVGEIIISRLSNKYRKIPDASRIISSSVNKFISQTKLNNSALKIFEKELEEKFKKRANSTKKHNTHNTHSNIPRNAFNITKSFNSCVKSDKKEYREDKLWESIMRYQSHLYKQELLHSKMRKTCQMNILKLELDKQVEDKKRLNVKRLNEEKEYDECKRIELGKLLEDDKRKEINYKRRVINNREVLKNQAKDDSIRKQLNDMAAKKYEEDFVGKIKEQLILEKIINNHKSKMQKLDNTELMRENKMIRKQKLDEEAIVKKREKDDMDEYTRIYKEKELKLKEDRKVRDKKLQDVIMKMAETTLNKYKVQAENDKKETEYQKKKVLRDKLDDEYKNNQVKLIRENMNNVLNKQILERYKRFYEEKQVNKRQGEIWDNDYKKFTEELQQAKQKTLSESRNYAEVLDKQILETRNKKYSLMNKEEYLMNVKMITSAEKYAESVQHSPIKNIKNKVN